MTENLPAKLDADRALISEVALDIGKEVVAHIEMMYPAMFKAVASSAKLSIRNCVHNQIMAALDTVDADEIRDRLERRRADRRRLLKAHRDSQKDSLD